MRLLIPAALLAIGLAVPGGTQIVQGVSQTTASGDTTTVFTIAPASGTAATDYVKGSADALNYQMAAATLATSRAQRDDVKAFARQALDHATTQQKSLMAALSNADRKIARPSTELSSARKADLELLRRAPRAGFDNLYLTQQTDRAPAIWAMQKGYSLDGTDQPLRQVATAAVPQIEQDYGNARALTPAGLDASR